MKTQKRTLTDDDLVTTARPALCRRSSRLGLGRSACRYVTRRSTDLFEICGDCGAVRLRSVGAS